MPQNRETRRLTQNKQNTVEFKQGRPLDSQGNDGDITIRQLDDGVFLFFKALGKWYKTLNAQSQIIPETPNARNIGSPSKPLNKMYVSSNSIHIGNTKSEQGALRLEKDSTSNIDYLTFRKYGATKSTTLVEEEEVSGSRYIDLGGLSGSAKSPIFALPDGAATGMFKYSGGVHTILSFDTNNAQVNIPKGVLKFTETTAPSGGAIPNDGFGILFLDTSDDKLYYQHASLNGGNAIDLTLVTTLSNYLPLAGGTMTGSIYFTETSAASSTTAGLGQLWVKDDDPASLYYTNDDGEDIQITYNDHIAPTEQTRIQVRNDEGSTIPAGSPLYSKGEIGGSERILVGIADASDANKMPCIGISYEEMNTSSTQDNYAVVSGVYNTNITVTSVSEQNTIYVAPHGGTAPYLTITRPTATNHLIQNVGICIRQTATNVSAGTLVSAIGRTNDVPNLLTNTLHVDDDVKIEFGDADEYIKGDGSQLIISSSNQIDFNNSRLYDVNRITFNDLTTQTTAPVNKWSIQTGGYKTNNNSATTYYFQYRPNGENWANSDGSIASISIYDTYASMLVAPYDGKVTKISVHGYANDTGATDPFKFYVFKGTPVSGGGSMTLTQIGVTGTITPASLRQFVENTDITSSNTFSQHDAIFVMYKKDSTTANQDLYFSVTVSGEYT